MEQQPVNIGVKYLEALQQLLKIIDINAIQSVVYELYNIQKCGSMIFIAGNGGSAATGSHWTNDLGKMTKNLGLPPMRVINLSDSVPWLTALANDEGYEEVFAGQMENFAQRGDVLVVISASGNSRNLLRAVEMAKEKEMRSIGLLGFDGGALKDLLDNYIWIPTPKGEYQLVEDCHSILCHLITTWLRCLCLGTEEICHAVPNLP